MIETTIGKTITTVNDNKSKQRHIAVKDTDLRYACDYCSMRDLDCSVIMCGKDERSDGYDIHYELVKDHYKSQKNNIYATKQVSLARMVAKVYVKKASKAKSVSKPL